MNETKSCAACFSTIDARAAKCPHCAQRQPDAPALYRDVPGRLLGGVCAALALHFNWDITVMRVILVGSVLGTGGLGLWLYAMLWVMTPFERDGRSPAMRFLEWAQALFSPPAQAPASPGPSTIDSVHDDEHR